MRNTRSLSLEPEKKPFYRRYLAYAWCIVTNRDLFVLALLGQLRQFFPPDTADPADIKTIREKAKKNIGKACISKIHPDAGPLEIQEALRRTISAIDGFAFLSRPVEIKPARNNDPNKHIVLIKIGVNWGFGGYPTITSPESIYAVTKLCLEEAEKRGIPIGVIVGDESGIEVKRMNLKNGEEAKNLTRKNFEEAGVFTAVRLAILHYAEAMEKKGTWNSTDAGKLVEEMGGSDSFDAERFRAMLQDKDKASKVEEMARKAGVRVLPFDTVDDTKPEKVKVCYPEPHREMVKHFKEGFLIPKEVAEEVTDIINLPKPPGRHSILGNEGLSGAVKNYVGLMDGDQRIDLLHGSKRDRFYKQKRKDIPRIKKDETGIRPREFSRSSLFNHKFKRAGRKMAFYEKLAEIYLAFKDKERFCATDMRRTVSSIGPDFGDTIDIGAVIAAKDSVTLDVLAGAFLKKRYDEIGSWVDALIPGGDSFSEWLVGWTWLRKGTAFDLKSTMGANSYGLGPIDVDHILLQGLKGSDFRISEIEALARYLNKGRRGSFAKSFPGQRRARSWGEKYGANNPA